MKSFNNITIPAFILAIITLFSCQSNLHLNPADTRYTIDTIYITKSRDTGIVSKAAVWIFNNNVPLSNISVYINGNSAMYVDSGIVPFFNDSSVTRISVTSNIIKSIYIKEPTVYTTQDEGAAYFYNTDRLDSVIFYDLTHLYTPFVPIKKRFDCTYTNGNLDSLAVNMSENGWLGFSNEKYGNVLHFSYFTFGNQKQLIGLDVNEFLYINQFFNRFNNYSLFPYGQSILMMNDNLNSLNTNCKNLLSNIDSYGKQQSISYTFDETHNNRINEVKVVTITPTDNYTISYRFHYKS